LEERKKKVNGALETLIGPSPYHWCPIDLAVWYARAVRSWFVPDLNGRPMVLNCNCKAFWRIQLIQATLLLLACDSINYFSMLKPKKYTIFSRQKNMQFCAWLDKGQKRIAQRSRISHFFGSNYESVLKLVGAG
jgi:hypothetical protein